MYFDGASKIPTRERKEDPGDNLTRIRTVFVFLDNALILYYFFLTKDARTTWEDEVITIVVELALQNTHR